MEKLAFLKTFAFGWMRRQKMMKENVRKRAGSWHLPPLVQMMALASVLAISYNLLIYKSHAQYSEVTETARACAEELKEKVAELVKTKDNLGKGTEEYKKLIEEKANNVGRINSNLSSYEAEINRLKDALASATSSSQPKATMESIRSLASAYPGFPYYAPACNPTKSTWLEFAYDAPHYFPIRPFKMILGTQSKPCSYLPDCNAFSRGELEWPESFVIEVLIGILGDCPLRQCHVLDLGGNMGYVNSYAAALGAKVISVEPQFDLASANRATIELNCWQHRVRNLDGMITLRPDQHDANTEISNLWRPGMVDFKKKRETKRLYLGNIVTMFESTHLDFVKIDVDSIDIEILRFLIDWIRQGKITVHSFIIEKGCHHEAFVDLQQLGYNIFQLDHHLRARFFDAKGRDVYKYRGAPIPYLEAIGDEYLCRRGMRQLIKFPEANNLTDATEKCNSFHKTPFRGNEFPSTVTSWLITKESLLQTQVMESWTKSRNPVTKGLYRNEKFGMPGEQINPTPIFREDPIAQ